MDKRDKIYKEKDPSCDHPDLAEFNFIDRCRKTTDR